MKLALPLVVLLLVTATPAAWAAGGINLFWNDCSEAGTSLQAFACNTNAGFQVMNVSVVPPEDVPQLAGVSAIVRVAVAAGTVPDWWLTSAGECRQGAITCSYDPADNGTSCPDIWQGTPNLDVFASSPSPAFGANVLTLSSAAAVPQGSELHVVADGTELYVCRFVVLRSNSTGTGSCSGCELEACLVLVESKLQQPAGVGDFTLTDPDVRSWVAWQGERALPCPRSVPARNRTWGAVKELYH